MADALTPNFGFILIEIGASRDTWGVKLNDNTFAIDAALAAGAAVIDDKLDASAYTAADVLAKLVGVDGPGSTLDADTVDGHHAADFMLASGFTGAAILAALLPVDGPGSGLDADKLDGIDSTGFALAAHTHAYVPLAGGTGVGAALTGDLFKSGEGVFAHFADPTITKGRLYIATAAGADPTSQPGDIWLGY